MLYLSYKIENAYDSWANNRISTKMAEIQLFLTSASLI